MSVQDSLLNEKNIVLKQPVTETEEHNQMCSFNSDEMEDMCYFRQDDACGEYRIIVEEREIVREKALILGLFVYLQS